MRSYGKVSPRFWTGSTGKQIRSLGSDAQVVAMYLMTAPSSTMTGLYYLPLPILAHEIGSPIEGASKALRSLCGVGFCSYDDATEVVWVPTMARHQLGDELKPGDKRIAGMTGLLEPYKSSAFIRDFVDVYRDSFKLPDKVLRWALEAPSKPHRSQEQEQEQEIEQEQEQSEVAGPPSPPAIFADGTGVGSKPRKMASGDHASFIASFSSLFAEANDGASATWNGKNGKLASELLKAHGLAECVKRAENMFRAPPPWPKGPHDIGTLSQHFDKFAVPHQRAGGHFKVTGAEKYAGGEVDL